jgi:predicted HTH transcriptional regulator
MFERQKLAYMVWGVDDVTHEIVGTAVDLAKATKGSEDFLLFLHKYLRPDIVVHHRAFDIAGKHIEMLIIEPGYMQPVSFQGREYIRVSTSLKPLIEFPERLKGLWAITSSYSFEDATISNHMTAEQLFEKFSITKFLSIIGIEQRTRENALENLASRKLIQDNMQGGFEVSSLLAMCCAKNLDEFPQLRNRGPRVITYKGKDKLQVEDDTEGARGYIVGFEGLLSHVLSRIPSEEELQHGKRVRVYEVPRDAVREFLANALVHQDFTQPGRPLIEIYSDRVRFINPGVPLIEIDRFIDAPPTARNQNFVKLMRLGGYCEDRGSGVDRAVREIERAALPPPLFAQVEGSTSVTAFMPQHFADMTPEDRVRACFQHAQLLHEQNQAMSNGSLRTRFGLKDTQMSQVSNVIKDAIVAGKIKPQNEGQAPKFARYIPAYA